VQALPSLHVFVSSLTALQPVVGSQESSVHCLPSSHTVAGPGTHTLLLHLSPEVQAFPSSQFAVFGVFTQAPERLHVSSVHGFPSSQLLPPVGTQAPVTQWSPVVQPSLSLHVLVSSITALHPVTVSQESSVHGLPSSQTVGGPATQILLLHLSPEVQALPSSQFAVLAVWTQALALQESSVHGFASSQLLVPTQTPAWHFSSFVHELVSTQVLPVRGVFLQTSLVSSQEAVLH
jgi:hypothetical protein